MIAQETPVRQSNPPPPAIDELEAVSPAACASYAEVRRILLRRPKQALSRTTARARQLMRDLGVTFHLYGEEAARDHIVPFDLFPRILDAAEWELLARGVIQRTNVWNAFFKDVYDSQEVLKTGTLPFELVYDDPHYQRAAVGVRVTGDVYAHVAAFDLARDQAGRWRVIEDYVSTSGGASYALQCRHVLTQVCPELFKGADVAPIHGYPTELLEHLRRFAQAASGEPRVVVLSSGLYNSAHYEHSYLARAMGVPLVRDSDLIVLNTRVFLKTIGGLEPIDVIYRLVEDWSLDPLSMGSGESGGVPGLLSCVRKGTVTVANAIGAGLGNNRALSTHLPKLARFYLNEALLLPSVERFVCFDRDQCEHVLGELEGLCVSSVSNRSFDQVWHGPRLSPPEIEALRARLLASPADYVAEEYLPLALLPCCDEQGLVSRHAGLRVFVFGGPSPRLYPIALTRSAAEPGSRVISSGLGGHLKDTWVLRGPADEQPAPSAALVSPTRRLRLGSRTAESLYWMGRYAERAENTTRIFKVLQQIQLEDQAVQTAQAWAPLWEALARATGHATHFFKRARRRDGRNLARYILLDRANPSSVASCVARCRDNAQAVRESIPPEVWVIINRLHQIVEEGAGPGGEDSKGAPDPNRVLELVEQVLNQLDALAGSASKSSLRDDGWHFWSMGVNLDRAATTVLVLRQAFLKRAGERERAQFLDANLDALLRMLSCLYAYRSLYQARPTPQNVASLLLQDPQLPRSLLYCLERFSESLTTVFGSGQREEKTSPRRVCDQLKAEVAFIDLTGVLAAGKGGKPGPLPRWLDEVAGRLNGMSTAVADHYLYHQAINILR
jgi:uncharacterized circularly permuted ATP-grasp superfamily protein/uncharacterized alpha-E superfamily protein